MQENKNFQQINAPKLYLRSYLAPAKSGDFYVVRPVKAHILSGKLMNFPRLVLESVSALRHYAER